MINLTFICPYKYYSCLCGFMTLTQQHDCKRTFTHTHFLLRWPITLSVLCDCLCNSVPLLFPINSCVCLSLAFFFCPSVSQCISHVAWPHTGVLNVRKPSLFLLLIKLSCIVMLLSLNILTRPRLALLAGANDYSVWPYLTICGTHYNTHTSSHVHTHKHFGCASSHSTTRTQILPKNQIYLPVIFGILPYSLCLTHTCTQILPQSNASDQSSFSV